MTSPHSFFFFFFPKGYILLDSIRVCCMETAVLDISDAEKSSLII